MPEHPQHWLCQQRSKEQSHHQSSGGNICLAFSQLSQVSVIIVGNSQCFAATSWQERDPERGGRWARWRPASGRWSPPSGTRRRNSATSGWPWGHSPGRRHPLAGKCCCGLNQLMLTFFSPDKFKNKDSIEEISSKSSSLPRPPSLRRGSHPRPLTSWRRRGRTRRSPSPPNHQQVIWKSKSFKKLSQKEGCPNLTADLVTRLESTLKTEGQPPTSSKVPLYWKFHSLNFNLDIFSNKMCLF